MAPQAGGTYEKRCQFTADWVSSHMLWCT